MLYPNQIELELLWYLMPYSSLKIRNFEGETYIDTEGFCYNKKIIQTIAII